MGFAQDKAQDADRHQLNQPRSTISPQGEGDPYDHFWGWSNSPRGKINVKYRHAKVDNIIGKWEFLGAEKSTIEFEQNELEKSFYLFNGEIGSGSRGTWNESYNNKILTLTLRHQDIDVVEKLAVQHINRKKLALGSIVNGEFVCRSHIKKRK